MEKLTTSSPLGRNLKGYPYEWKIVALRECPPPSEMPFCTSPQEAVNYWRSRIQITTGFEFDRECFAVLHLNTRRRIRGHYIAGVGTLDSVVVHAREVFRAAILAASAALVLMHNHPSGEPDPSEADIRITRELIKAGQLLRIEILDHVIVGNDSHCSLRERGYFL